MAIMCLCIVVATSIYDGACSICDMAIVDMATLLSRPDSLNYELCISSSTQDPLVSQFFSRLSCLTRVHNCEEAMPDVHALGTTGCGGHLQAKEDGRGLLGAEAAAGWHGRYCVRQEAMEGGRKRQ